MSRRDGFMRYLATHQAHATVLVAAGADHGQLGVVVVLAHADAAKFWFGCWGCWCGCLLELLNLLMVLLLLLVHFPQLLPEISRVVLEPAGHRVGRAELLLEVVNGLLVPHRCGLMGWDGKRGD